jgi:photosystem II stability/assembly factor-like uncharacterized protein
MSFLPVRLAAATRAHRFRLTRSLGKLALWLSALTLTALSPATRATPLDYHRAATDFRAQQLRDENGKIPAAALSNAVQQKLSMPVNLQAWPGALRLQPGDRLEPRIAGLDALSWDSLGPGNIGGRVRSLVVHPTNQGILWAGSVCGGVWKTVNGGTQWFPCDDLMVNLAIGCLVLDPGNPEVIYAGTGEGLGNADALRGAGIFKSTNAGTNWTQLAATASPSFYYVNRLAISPTNHLLILAATGSGIWRSMDAGLTWSQTYAASGALNVTFHPWDGSKCIASGFSGLALYSTNGGQTWNAAAGLASAGRVEVAYAVANPATVYASQDNNSGQLYLSSDGGSSYALRNTGTNYLGGQGWYDNSIWVDPVNPNILIVGGIDLWRSTNGGLTLTQISQWSSAPYSPHADHHAIVNISGFDGSTNKTVFFATDGGIYSATNIYGVSLLSGWTELNNNLGVTEFYAAAGSANTGTIVGGAQDNGTLRYGIPQGTEGWTLMNGGDGGFCASDPTDSNYFYGERPYLDICRSGDGGISSSYIYSGIGDAAPSPNEENPPEQTAANFVAPFVLDPNNPNVLLAGGTSLWRSTNVKALVPVWTAIKTGTGSLISALAVAPGNSDIIWVGHNNGDVYATTNGTAPTPTWVRKDVGSPNLPNRFCTRITIDPFDFTRVYTTFGGFSSDNVYRTTDSGATWTNIAPGLPSAPVHSLVIAPFNTNFLYLGTEVGVFASPDGGATWSPGNECAANVCVNELFWMGRRLVAATQGRGLFQILVSTTPIISLTGSALVSETCSNSLIDPGELVTVSFTLSNLVTAPTTNLVATLLQSGGVMSPSGPQSYGLLARGKPAVTRSFSFVASGQCGGTISPTLLLKDGTNDLGSVNTFFRLGTNKILLAENFDMVTPPALPGGWTVSWVGGGTPWTTTSALSDSSPNAAFASNATSVSDNSLISIPIPIATASAQLSFRHNYDTETHYDGAVLEIAMGSGSFSDILTAGGSFVTNGYNESIATGLGNPLAGRPAWSGNSSGFITTVVNLPAAAAGQVVRLRWRFGSDSSVGINGWYVDTISLTDGYVCCQAVRPLIQSLTLATNSVVLGWTSVSNSVYRLQYKTNLSNSTWFDVSGDVVANGPVTSKTNLVSPVTQRFYRVVLLP